MAIEEERRMRTRLTFPHDLITGIDVMNTLNGGMSEPVVKLSHFPTHRQITVHIPGIDVDQVKIEINNNHLMIYYITTLISRDQELRVPKVLYNKQIPYFVDSKNITATEEKNLLVIRLPFNELADGHHRDVTIKR
jgi:HSP20 family molecular chaperone IbpA